MELGRSARLLLYLCLRYVASSKHSCKIAALLVVEKDVEIIVLTVTEMSRNTLAPKPQRYFGLSYLHANSPFDEDFSRFSPNLSCRLVLSIV